MVVDPDFEEAGFADVKGRVTAVTAVEASAVGSVVSATGGAPASSAAAAGGDAADDGGRMALPAGTTAGPTLDFPAEVGLAEESGTSGDSDGLSRTLKKIPAAAAMHTIPATTNPIGDRRRAGIAAGTDTLVEAAVAAKAAMGFIDGDDAITARGGGTDNVSTEVGEMIFAMRSTEMRACAPPNGASATASDATSGYRFSGFFSRHFMMTASSSSGASLRASRNGVGLSAMIAAQSAGKISAKKGGEPVKSSCSEAPSDQMSERLSTVFALRTCSGDM